MLSTASLVAPPELATELAELRLALLAEQRRREEAEAEVVRLQELAHVPILNPNPVLRLAADGTVRFANPAAEALALELRTTGPSVLRPRLQSATTEALRTGAPQVRELRTGGQDFVLYVVPAPEENCALLYLTNITAQRAAEQELREQQELHELTLRHLPASVSVLDADQRCRYHNSHDPAGPEQLDWRIGRTFGEFCMHYELPFTLATRRRRLFERAVRTRAAVEWEEQWPTPSGAQQPTYWLRSYQPVFAPDGRLRLMMSYGLDITRRREAEEATRRSEAAVLTQQAFTSLVLDTLPNLVFVRDAEGKIVFSNAALREAWAEQSRTADGSPDGVAQQEHRRYAEASAQVLQTGQRITTDDAFTLASSEVRWYQTIRQPLRLPGGGPSQVLGVCTDITDLKRAKQAAEAAASARENFLANMSHEIRTPLNGVLGMAGLLAGTALNAEQQQFLSVIRNSGRNLLAVLNDVLDMAKITSGKLELEHIAFDLPTALHTAAQTLAFRAAEKGLAFELKLPSALRRPAWVSGDPYRLNQVLLNLLSNAIKFTPQGSVTLTVQVLSRNRSHLRLRLLVQDTGPGITPERQEAVFDSFAQAYASTTREHGGTGLGLSISRGLVEQLAGSPLLLCSEQGQGSTFGFVLSLPRVAPPIAPVAGNVPAAAIRGRRVLLVEDNAVNRELARLLLVRHAVRVDQATNGTEALACFDEHRYDVVLMDIQMPGMNGLEATAHMRRHPDPARAATPIIALTANAFRADAERYRAAGLDDTLAKPFEESELLAKLATVLRSPAPDSETPATAELPSTPAAVVTSAPASFPTPPAAGQALPYDLTLLRETAQGSAAFMNRILATFRANTPASLAELTGAKDAANWTALAALAHRLRPTLRLLGAAPLLPVLAALEADDTPDAARATAAEAFERGLTELLRVLPPQVADEEPAAA